MPAPRITMVGLGGLQTAPGKEGFKPGACSVLKNLRPVAPNRLRGIAKFGTPAQGGTNGAEPVRTVELANGKSIVIQYTSGGSYNGYGDNTTANLYTYPSYVPSTGQLLADRIFPIIARDRVILNGNYGTLVSDFLDPDFSIALARKWRLAGLPQPQISSITEAAGSAVPTGVIVTYAAVIRREYALDGYQLTSPPSVFVRRLNDSGAAVDNTVRVNWIYADDVREGDVVELYRSNGIAGATYGTDSGAQCFLVASKAVSATDATNKYTDLTDLQRMAAPLYETYGVALYTNGDATQENNQPPVAAAQCTWQGTTFYGAIQEDPVLTLDPKATVGTLTTAWERANGIGTRSGAGTVTGGSATVTAIGAADLVGVKVGQLWAGSALIFPAGTRVQSVGGTSITFNQVASGPAATFSVCDTVYIDGVDYKFGGWGNLAQSIALAAYWELHTSATIANEQTAEEGVSATIRPIRHASTFAAKVTNAQNYNGSLQEYTSTAYTYGRATQGNLIRFSKANQSEAVPYANELRVGLGTVVSLHSTTGYVYALCTDGVYWITGTEGNYRSQPLDQSLIVASPMAAGAMNERVYAITNRGLVSFDASGVTPLSQGVVDDMIPGFPYSVSSTPWLQCLADNDELWMLFAHPDPGGTSAIALYSARYNMFSQLELAGSDAYVRSLSRTLATEFELPYIAVAMYTSAGAAPRYARFDDLGAPLPVTALLREAGEPMTVSQFIDFTVVLDLASAGETVRSLVNSETPLGTATMQAARVDARASFGIPRADAVRPQLSAGFAVAAPTRLIDVLGLSFRVVPKTTQQVNR